MTGGSREDVQRRLTEIEDRKIEILLEIASIEGKDTGRISELISEYSELDKVQYRMKMEMIRKRRTRL